MCFVFSWCSPLQSFFKFCLHAPLVFCERRGFLMLREVERRTGKPGGFIESDLVDPRYFSASNIKNRLESYFQMLSQRRTTGGAS